MQRFAPLARNEQSVRSTGAQPDAPTFIVGALIGALSRIRATGAHGWIIGCGVLLAIGIGGATAVLISNQYHRAIKDTERELANIALTVAEQSDRTFQGLELVQKSLIERTQALGIRSSTDFERRMAGEDVNRLLKDKISGLPQADTVSLISAKGKLVNSSRQWPTLPIDLSDRNCFQVIKSDPAATTFVTQPAHNPDGWTIALARKFQGQKGEFAGLVLAAIKLDYFEKFFGTISLGGQSSIALISADGTLLVRYPHVDAVIGKRFTNVSDLLGGSDHGNIRLISTVDNKERLFSIHRLANYPIAVSVGLDVDAALANWRHESRAFASGAALLILVILGMTVLGVRYVGNYDLLAQARAEKEILKEREAATTRLQEQKLQLDTALNNMQQGLLMFDAAGRLVLYNQRFLQMYRLALETVKLGCTFSDLLWLRKAAGTFRHNPDQYVAKLVDRGGPCEGDPDQALARLFSGGKIENKELTLPDGRVIAITNQATPTGGWVSVHEDITERRRLENERDRNQQFLNAVIENVPVTIFVKDARERRYLLLNRSAERLWGRTSEDVIGKTAYDLFPKQTADMIDRRDCELLDSENHFSMITHEVEFPNDGRRLISSRRIAILGGDQKPQYLVGVIEDVTERVRSEERIAHLAHYDALTDLPNRLLFGERLNQALARVERGERLALLYLDLDDFKRVNDTLGHSVGDELLKVVADRLRGCVRDIDSIARLGGDEFAVVQTSLEQVSDAAALATRIRDAIKEPIRLGHHRVAVDVSIGIAIAPEDGIERDELVKNADMALYGAKTAGRGSYCFFAQEMNERMKARDELEQSLRRAIVGGEFELHYQPVVNLARGKINGFEALLRWRHPDRGMVAPSEFISVAEETGLIVPLGEWVLRKACADAATWPDDVAVAVNLSPAQFKSTNLIGVIVGALAASGLPARRLELEITESVLMENTEATVAILRQLREFGVRIAMDDFGTGYSSLSYLRSFPFDKIKIDRSFVSDLSSSDDGLAIVRSVTSLANSLKMTTTAEGVETEAQLERLRAVGCTEMQGFLFSPPRPLAELAPLFLLGSEQVASAA